MDLQIHFYEYMLQAVENQFQLTIGTYQIFSEKVKKIKS